MILTPTSMDWAYRTDGWSAAMAALFLFAAAGGAVFLNPSLLMGRIPRVRELEVGRQIGLIRVVGASVGVIGLLTAAGIFYGAY